MSHVVLYSSLVCWPLTGEETEASRQVSESALSTTFHCILMRKPYVVGLKSYLKIRVQKLEPQLCSDKFALEKKWKERHQSVNFG